MHLTLQRHTRIALFNLALIATIGVILRYKIAFSLPFLDQKHLLHGHSHFAFAGWISQALMVLLVNYLLQQNNDKPLSKYKWILNANLITAYGMLVSFPLQGYGLFSISFSTLSIFVSYIFAFHFWKDLNRLPHKNTCHWWMKAALLFNALSSLGAFSLAFMMATKTVHQNWYLAAVYFFLHFQYNGWFFFACMGLATAKFFINVSPKVLKIIFWLFAGACIPAYVLSALWLPIPSWTYLIVVLAAFSQLAGWLLSLQHIKKQFVFIRSVSKKEVRWIIVLAGIALTIKLLLQLGSTIPALSVLAFGFRPIVIGYLHLILLGVITLYLLGFFMQEQFITLSKRSIAAVKLFVAGIIINELLLMTQGIAAMTYTPLPFINELLLGAALILFTGIFLINISQKR
ncbi:MAG: hypothetical protein U0V75_18035 [Ferruginibacter sp.]